MRKIQRIRKGRKEDRWKRNKEKISEKTEVEVRKKKKNETNKKEKEVEK